MRAHTHTHTLFVRYTRAHTLTHTHMARVFLLHMLLFREKKGIERRLLRLLLTRLFSFICSRRHCKKSSTAKLCRIEWKIKHMTWKHVTSPKDKYFSDYISSKRILEASYGRRQEYHRTAAVMHCTHGVNLENIRCSKYMAPLARPDAGLFLPCCTFSM